MEKFEKKKFQYVPVLDKDKKAMMPCHPARARELMKIGEAKPYWSNGIFCIILQREPSSYDFQEVAIGIDSGSKMEAYTIQSEANTLLNIQCKAITDVKDKVEARKNMRRGRRNRKCPYRANRSNRASLKKGRIPPSTKARWGLKLRMIQWLKKLYPISHIVVEDIKAYSKKGQKRWNRSFSPLEVGKSWFYKEVKKLGELTTFQGYETKEMRDKRCLNKSKDKLSVRFDTHCVDSFCLAAETIGGTLTNKKILFLQPLRFFRRQLHAFQFAKGGKRRNYGGTRSMGISRGTLVKHSKWGFCLVGGNSKNRISLHNMFDFKRLCQNAKPEECKILTNFRWTVQWL